MMPVLVTGMHRSGTSLVSHITRQLGANLGDPKWFCEANEENPHGFHEFLPLSLINRALLQESHRYPGDVLPHIEASLLNQAIDLVRQHHLDGFKDPRTMLLLPFWIRVFGANTRIIRTYRPHQEIADSLRKRGDLNTRLEAHEIINGYEEKFLKDVHAHGVDVHVVSYAALISDPVIEGLRIAHFLGIEHFSIGDRVNGIVDIEAKHHTLGNHERWWEVVN